MRGSTTAALLAVIVVLSACSDGESAPPTAEPTSEVLVIRASSDLAVGTERVLLALAGSDGTRLGSPDLAVMVAVWPEDDPSQRQEVAGTFTWAIPDRSGLYRATVEFDRAGVWIAEVMPAEGPVPAPVPLFVNASPVTPAPGEEAPASESPTAADAEAIAAISTDPDPDPRLYAMSVAEAVTSGRPSVIVFSTPKFCQTAICGPTLEIIKSMVDQHPEVNFVHVEVFDLAASPADATSIDQLVLAPAVVEWALPSEPWVFVVDAQGVVAGRFEGVISPAEITNLLA